MLIIAILVISYLIYSRPMTIEERNKTLSLDKCTGIEGYYRDDTMTDLEKFTVSKDSEEFELLCELLYEREYRRSLKDICSKGTRMHQVLPGDFQWEVFFCFENIELADGNMGGGAMLQIQSWYGELSIKYADSERGSMFCHTKEQKAWAADVFEIILQAVSAK